MPVMCPDYCVTTVMSAAIQRRQWSIVDGIAPAITEKVV